MEQEAKMTIQRLLLWLVVTFSAVAPAQGVQHDSKKNSQEDVESEVDRLVLLKRQIAIEGVIVFLDSYLCLSQPQVDQIQVELAKVWEDEFNLAWSMAPLTGVVGGENLLDVVDDAVWKSLLTEGQFERYDNLEKLAGSRQSLQTFVISPESTSTEELDKILDGAMNMKFAELELLVGIDDSQRRLLNVAKKGAIAKVKKRIEEMAEQYRENSDILLIVEAIEPLVAKCIQEEVWQRSLAKAFDASDLEKMHKRERARQELATSQTANYLVLAMTGQTVDLKLGFQQHRKLVQLIRSKLSEDSGNYLEILQAVFSIEKEEFLTVMTEEQWGMFETFFESQKGSFQLDDKWP